MIPTIGDPALDPPDVEAIECRECGESTVYGEPCEACGNTAHVPMEIDYYPERETERGEDE